MIKRCLGRKRRKIPRYTLSLVAPSPFTHTRVVARLTQLDAFVADRLAVGGGGAGYPLQRDLQRHHRAGGIRRQTQVWRGVMRAKRTITSNASLLRCEARGYPEPSVLWRREDGAAIALRGGGESDRTRRGETIVKLSLRHKSILSAAESRCL